MINEVSKISNFLKEIFIFLQINELIYYYDIKSYYINTNKYTYYLYLYIVYMSAREKERKRTKKRKKERIK